MKRVICLWLFFGYFTLQAQEMRGIVVDSTDGMPVAYTNIGIAGADIGTVSKENGEFSLAIETEFAKDTVLFSAIGYESRKVAISELRANVQTKVLMLRKTYELAEVCVKPIKSREKTLGVTSHSKKFSAGFRENILGYECGILMKQRKSAYLKTLKINIAGCSYDSIFYRVNIYKVHGSKKFENILHEPIYLKLSKEELKDEVQMDLSKLNLVVEGDFLVTLEHVKNLGKGYLFFCAGLGKRTYYRKTSQSDWQSAGIGLSISVLADVTQ